MKLRASVLSRDPMKILRYSTNQTGRYHRAQPVEAEICGTGERHSADTTSTIFLSLQTRQGGSHQLGERFTLEFSDADANEPIIVAFLAHAVARLASDSRAELTRRLRQLGALTDDAYGRELRGDARHAESGEAQQAISYDQLLEIVGQVHDANPNAGIDQLPASTLRLLLIAIVDNLAVASPQRHQGNACHLKF